MPMLEHQLEECPNHTRLTQEGRVLHGQSHLMVMKAP